MWPKEFVFVVCEGTSEENYLQWLSSFFNRSGIPLVLKPYKAGTGDFRSIQAAYNDAMRDARQNRLQPDVVIWVDKDIYFRNDRKNGTKYAQKKAMPDFKFSYMNYEDFLTLHDDKWLEKWMAICQCEAHFSKPMKSEVCFPLFRQYLFPMYKKGSLPDEFACVDESKKAVLIKTMLSNNSKAEKTGGNVIHCDFASYLAELLASIKNAVSDKEVADFISSKLLP